MPHAAQEGWDNKWAKRTDRQDPERPLAHERGLGRKGGAKRNTDRQALQSRA